MILDRLGSLLGTKLRVDLDLLNVLLIPSIDISKSQVLPEKIPTNWANKLQVDRKSGSTQLVLALRVPLNEVNVSNRLTRVGHFVTGLVTAVWSPLGLVAWVLNFLKKIMT